MDQDAQPPTPFPNVATPPSEPIGTDSEITKSTSEDVRNEPVEPSEKVEDFPKLKQRTPDHNTTIRSARELFEVSGYPITERTILNWCYPTTDHPAKLDCAWDGRKYFINQESLEKAMADIPKAIPSQPLPKFQKELRQNSESNQELPKEQKETSEGAPKGSETQDNSSEEDRGAELRQLRRETLEQANTIIGKDKVIDTMQSGLEKTFESFTKTLKESSIEQGRLLAENEQLRNLLGDGVPARKPDMREPVSASVENNEGDEDQDQPNE